jgi:hypothetical protein
MIQWEGIQLEEFLHNWLRRVAHFFRGAEE